LVQDFKFTDEELRRFVEVAGEEPRIDHKGPMKWDGDVHAASLTKDILACANIRTGGVLVIGVEEQEGRFNRVGLSDEEARSFDTTKVATWVNGYCEPDVQVGCYPIQLDEKT